MDLNSAGDCPQREEVCNRFHTTGVPVGGNSMTDISPQSGGEDKFIAEGFGNRTSGFKQCFEMFFGGLLKAQRGFAAVASMRVTAGQQQ